MRRIGHVRSPVKCSVRVVPAGSQEAREQEEFYEVAVGALCPHCERIAKETNHIASCPAAQKARAEGRV